MSAVVADYPDEQIGKFLKSIRDDPLRFPIWCKLTKAFNDNPNAETIAYEFCRMSDICVEICYSFIEKKAYNASDQRRLTGAPIKTSNDIGLFFIKAKCFT